jgi:hypothetical protein
MALTLRPTWPGSAGTDWTIFDNGQPVGRIYIDHGAPTPWLWCLNETAGKAHQVGIRGSGRAEKLGEAKVAFQAAYDRWLAWVDQHGADSDSKMA